MNITCCKIFEEKKIKISGPFPADTIFLKNNRKKFDVIVGMYHDQVLTPMKTILISTLLMSLLVYLL